MQSSVSETAVVAGRLAGVLLGTVVLGGVARADAPLAEPYYDWQVESYAISQPLGGLRGDAAHGKQVVIARDKGNCLACHSMPIPEEPFHGTVGPPLQYVGSRLSEGQIRLRVVDERRINPQTVMPGYYRHPRSLTLVLDDFEGTTFLTAQEVEDVVAYLVTLK